MFLNNIASGSRIGSMHPDPTFQYMASGGSSQIKFAALGPFREHSFHLTTVGFLCTLEKIYPLSEGVMEEGEKG
jgi:hypothetical protein